MNDELDVIASREFTWVGADEVERSAFIDITRPVPIINEDPALTDWGCRVISRGFGRDGSHEVIGVDSVHAIVNALILAGSLVGASLVSLAADIDWAELDNFGFPRDPNANQGGLSPEPVPDPAF
jgi:hypothetical protein